MPVGVEDGRIPEEAFSASSYHSASYLPDRGRLNLLPSGGKYCWAAKQNNANQWLQVRNCVYRPFMTLERLRFTFTPNGKREFVPRDQVFPLFFVYCLFLLHKNK